MHSCTPTIVELSEDGAPCNLVLNTITMEYVEFAITRELCRAQLLWRCVVHNYYGVRGVRYNYGVL